MHNANNLQLYYAAEQVFISWVLKTQYSMHFIAERWVQCDLLLAYVAEYILWSQVKSEYIYTPWKLQNICHIFKGLQHAYFNSKSFHDFLLIEEDMD